MSAYLEPFLKLANLSFIALLVFFIIQNNETNDSDRIRKEQQISETLKTSPNREVKQIKEASTTKVNFVGESALKKHFNPEPYKKSSESPLVENQNSLISSTIESQFNPKKKEIKLQNKPLPKIFDVESNLNTLTENTPLTPISFKPTHQKKRISPPQVMPLKFENLLTKPVKQETTPIQILKTDTAAKPLRSHKHLAKTIEPISHVENLQKQGKDFKISKSNSAFSEVLKSTKPKEENIQLAALDLEKLVKSEGLSITFYWPEAQDEREAVYHILQHCHNMTLGVFDANMILFDQHNKRLSKTEISNISPMLRHVSAPVTALESGLLGQLRKRQPGPMVRIFPKRFDAFLIASLRQNANINKNIKGRITANYSIENGEIFLENWNLNGKTLSGNIELSGFSTQCG